VNDILVVVPCGSTTVWSRNPHTGPTEAYHAYVGTPFKLKRAYAERFADRWVMLSAKYGLIRPNFSIPEPYLTSFTNAGSNPISLQRLKEQVVELKLDRYRVVVGLGSKIDRMVVERAFEDTDAITVFPFAGLPTGTAMKAMQYAMEIGDSGIPRPQPKRPLIG
jgi:hypothetical protein